QLLDMMPGMGKAKGLKNMQIDESQMGRVEAIVKSMTTEEKRTPSILNASRRKRIAAGRGTSVKEVNRFLQQFEDMKKMMKQFSAMMGPGGCKGGKRKMGRGFRLPF